MKVFEPSAYRRICRTQNTSNLLTYPHFSFRKFTIYFSKSIKECFIENSLANACIIWREIFQNGSFVLSVHMENNSQCYVTNFINSVLQSSRCKLKREQK